MADGAAYRVETTFLRECAKTYVSEIGFSKEAERQMLVVGVYWPSVYQVLTSGHLVWSDKEEADCTKSIFVGDDCDGERLRLTLRWSATHYSVLVVSVERL